MSVKAVVRVEVVGSNMDIIQKDGSVQRAPLTDKVKRKMAGLESAYFYGKVRPDGISLYRFAPVSAWQEAA